MILVCIPPPRDILHQCFWRITTCFGDVCQRILRGEISRAYCSTLITKHLPSLLYAHLPYDMRELSTDTTCRWNSLVRRFRFGVSRVNTSSIPVPSTSEIEYCIYRKEQKKRCPSISHSGAASQSHIVHISWGTKRCCRSFVGLCQGSMVFWRNALDKFALSNFHY